MISRFLAWVDGRIGLKRDTDVDALRAENERLRQERDGYRARQVEAENALAILLIREGGSTEITQAELVGLDRRGSLVTSWTVTGDQKLAYVTPRPKQAREASNV